MRWAGCLLAALLLCGWPSAPSHGSSLTLSGSSSPRTEVEPEPSEEPTEETSPPAEPPPVEPTPTVTETVVVEVEPTTEPCGTESNPCLVEPVEGTTLWLVCGIGLGLMLLSAVLVAQLRRPA